MFKNSFEYLAALEERGVVSKEAKPIVRYSAIEGTAAVGHRVIIVPIDHPADYLNGDIVYTSSVVSVEADGSFETRNTRYVRAN